MSENKETELSVVEPLPTERVLPGETRIYENGCGRAPHEPGLGWEISQEARDQIASKRTSGMLRSMLGTSSLASHSHKENSR